jgi:glycosyltransferase involved in cell wall biosynthesis
VAIDIRRISDFGVGTYIRNIVRALSRLDQRNKYYLIGAPEKIQEIGPLPPNFHNIAFTETDTSARGYFGFRTILGRLGCNLVHIPHLFWLPRALPCPYVVTVHDVLEHMSRTKDHSGARRLLHFQFTRRVLLGASRVFAVSQFTKSELEKLFSIPAQNVEVVYNAIDERFMHGHASETDRALIVQRYQVTYPFVLYAGRISPHKNLVRIIEAFSALRGELEKDGKFPDLKLIIIGDELSKNPDLRRTVIKSGVQNDVRFLGFVPIEVLRILYDLAKVFVFPSLYEGFGLPPLEAMVHGTPVVTSNTSSLPEVVGNAAVLVNPENVFEIMRALHRVLVDQTLREKMKRRSLEQSKRFSWESSARRVLHVYREVTKDAAPREEHRDPTEVSGKMVNS